MKRDCSIYAIVCPVSKKVRYVGKTIERDVRRRIINHYLPKNGGIKSDWLNSLTELPIIIILEKCNSRGANGKEMKWIKRFLKEGCSLFNKIGVEPIKCSSNMHPIRKAKVIDLADKTISKTLEEITTLRINE